MVKKPDLVILGQEVVRSGPEIKIRWLSEVWGLRCAISPANLSFKFAQSLFSSREIRCVVQSVMRCYITSRLMISCWRLIK